MFNRDLQRLLTKMPAKNEIEFELDGVILEVQEIKRRFIPEDEEERTPARNLVQISLKRGKNSN